MTPEQRFDIVLYRLNSAKSLLDEIKDHIERGYYNTAIIGCIMPVFML